MQNIIFIYHKEGKIKVLNYADAIDLEQKMITEEGWQHTATIDAATWIQNLANKNESIKNELAGIEKKDEPINENIEKDVNENLIGLSDFIKDEDILDFYKGVVIEMIKHYASQPKQDTVSRESYNMLFNNHQEALEQLSKQDTMPVLSAEEVLAKYSTHDSTNILKAMEEYRNLPKQDNNNDGDPYLQTR